MRPLELLKELGERRIALWAEEGRLRFRAPEGALTPALRERVAALRGELLLHFQEQGPDLELPEASPWERFAEVVRRAPGAPALEEGGLRLTYGELERRAGCVAGELAARGIGRGDRVGLILPRGAGLVAAMLGVVRLGAVFVPFDGAQPRERLALMVAQARLGAVLALEGDPAAAGMASTLVRLGPATWDREGAPPDPGGLEDPLYMIFTSGSTGVPKAVEVPWRPLCNLVQNYHAAFAPRPGERVSQIASPSFDASLFEMWPALLAGATLVIVPEPLKMDPEALRDWLLDQGIHLHFSPTPLAEALLTLDWPRPAPLRLLFSGGQALHQRPRPEHPFALWNVYGPTEAGIVSTWAPVAPGEGQPTLGLPLGNTRLRILDEAGDPAEAGELHIAGAGLARGYFDQPEATADRFRRGEGTWYRTGDRVRRLPDGNLAFLGRVDRQVKLRGYRIELGEVESALRRLPGVAQAAVLLRGERMVAYLEGDPGPDPRAQLARLLPEYMLPVQYVPLERLPRTSSGKIDVQALGAGRPA